MMRRVLTASMLFVLLLTSLSCRRSCEIRVLCQNCFGEQYTATFFYFRDNQYITVRVGFDGVAVVPADSANKCDKISLSSIQPLNASPIIASPQHFDLSAAPTTFDFYGQDINSSYGLPVIDYYDGDGNWICSVTAYSLSNGWCQASAPSFVQRYDGLFSAYIRQMAPGGYYVGIGTARFIGDGRPRPDQDGDGYANDVDCDDSDPFTHPGQDPDCHGHHYDMNCDGIPDEQQCWMY